jgi:hypothetical protein
MVTQVLALVSAAIFLVGTTNTAWAQSKAASPRRATESNTPKAGPVSKAGIYPQEAAAMAADLERMRGLLNQLQTNLAFVQTTTTPLKHQFELEIDMWQTLLNQMQRRLDNLSGTSPNTESQNTRPEP